MLTIQAGAGVVTVSEATKKILLNYLQVVSMAALFPMQWPEEVESFFAVQSAISSASKALDQLKLEKFPDAKTILQSVSTFSSVSAETTDTKLLIDPEVNKNSVILISRLSKNGSTKRFLF